MKSSGNTSMIITAFGFMILMLVVTAPSAGTGPAPVVYHGPGPVLDNITPPSASQPPVLPMAGSGPAPDPVMARVRNLTNLQPVFASATGR